MKKFSIVAETSFKVIFGKFNCPNTDSPNVPNIPNSRSVLCAHTISMPMFIHNLRHSNNSAVKIRNKFIAVSSVFQSDVCIIANDIIKYHII